jgi:tetratricopeptide (TPR) repeat protein
MKQLKRMMIIVLILIASSFIPWPAQGEPEEGIIVVEQQINEIFDIANEEYKAGNYENAARLYEGMFTTFSVMNADIYYNLGNAYFKLNRYGKAIASYKRALQISPREQDVMANLLLARSVTRDKVDSPKSTELLHELFFFHYGVNRAESELMFLIAYCFAVLFGVITLFRKSGGARWASLAALAVATVFGLSALAHAYREMRPSEAVVIASEATAHSGPGESYLISFHLHDGAELEVRKRMDEWRQIELSDGRRGWINESEIEII